MNHEELFVGAVSIVLGVAGVLAAVGNRDRYYQLDKVRWLEEVAGRWCVRALYALLGALLIALGVAIAAGLAPSQVRSDSEQVGGSSWPPASEAAGRSAASSRSMGS